MKKQTKVVVLTAHNVFLPGRAPELLALLTGSQRKTYKPTEKADLIDEWFGWFSYPSHLRFASEKSKNKSGFVYASEYITREHGDTLYVITEKAIGTGNEVKRMMELFYENRKDHFITASASRWPAQGILERVGKTASFRGWEYISI